ncbi:MAG: hypothetical protein IT366_15225 [Candidatus Hydrogenedentes bacterium]|nr:hypothetical protein [Candidatus Hydrogenedentota bacterium]
MGCSLSRLCALVALAGPLAFAGTLRMGVPEVNGNQVVLPVLLEGDTGAGVAALDFTLNYDPAVFTPVRAEASEAAQAARKQVESNEVSPGNYVIMMFGMNQTTLNGGQVAEITLTKKNQPASNQSDISIEQTTFASIEGSEIESSGSSQTVTFPPPPADDDGNDPPPANENPPPDNSPAETPKPTIPVDTPDTQAPSVPGTPGGAPSQPEPPKQEAPRATPMKVASTILDEPKNDSGGNRTVGVARMNRAAQRLENSRAALNSPGSNALDSGAQEGGGDSKLGTGAAQSASSPDANLPNTETREIVTVASAGTDALSASKELEEEIANDRADTSGIPPSSRRMLVIVGSIIAAALVAYRFALKRTQKIS